MERNKKNNWDTNLLALKRVELRWIYVSVIYVCVCVHVLQIMYLIVDNVGWLKTTRDGAKLNFHVFLLLY